MFKNRIVLVSDSGRCCGLPDGTEFDIGGQTATLIQGVARLGNGTIACSATNLYDCMVNAMRFQIPEAEAVRAASYNPAKALGVQNEVGSIAEGMVADFLVCRDNYRSKTVYLAGKAL